MDPTYKEIQSYLREDTAISSHFFGYYPHFLRAIFGAYSFLLFGFSVIYFLSRIVGYKLGFMQSPKYSRYGSGKSYRRGIR